MKWRSPVKDVILSLGSLTECPLAIGSLVRSSGPEAPDNSCPSLLDERAWGPFSELNTFKLVAHQTRAEVTDTRS